MAPFIRGALNFLALLALILWWPVQLHVLFSVDISHPTRQLRFVAWSGTQIYGGIGTDDVTVEPNSCENINKFNCDFNKAKDGLNSDLCAYTQELSTDEFDWSVSEELSGTNSTISEKFLRALNLFGYIGFRARLVSPLVTSYIPLCLSFRYRVSSASAGFLHVCKQYNINGIVALDCSVWSSRYLGFQPVWTTAHVGVSASLGDFSLVFDMVQGQGQGYIDIDDIVRKDGDCL